jgi:hypothetical protein
MIRLFILVFLLSADMIALAQKDSTLRIKNETIKNTYREPIRLTNPQQKWLNNNYKKIASLKKDSATAVISKNFTTIPEASLEYMISQAAQMLKGDNQQQLALLKQMLDQLKQQKQALLKKIQEKENQLAKETDPGKRNGIKNEILELKKKLKESEDNIRRKEETVRQIESNS